MLHVIVNTTAGTGKGADIPRLINRFRQDHPALATHIGGVYRVMTEEYESAVGKIAATAKKILICGGDGTVNRVINNLKQHGFQGKVGLFPIGTGNDIHRALGLEHRNLHETLKKLVESPEETPVDIFCVNGKVRFTNFIGFGYDGHVVNRVEQITRAIKKYGRDHLGSLKQIVYLTAGLSSALSYTRKLAEKSTAGHALNIIVANIRYYAAGCKLGERDSDIADGKLEKYVLPSKLDYIRLVLTRFGAPLGPVRGKTVDSPLKLSFDRPGIPIQIDGECYAAEFAQTADFEIQHEGKIGFIR